jgi:vacuolar-type H+-ATPase subunit C/Vma6
VLLEELGHAGTGGAGAGEGGAAAGGGAGSGGREGGREARELELIEAALDEETDRLVHRQLGSYPFTMGVVLAYYVLTQRELRRIAAVLNGLGYGLSADATGAAL